MRPRTRNLCAAYYYWTAPRVTKHLLVAAVSSIWEWRFDVSYIGLRRQDAEALGLQGTEPVIEMKRIPVHGQTSSFELPAPVHVRWHEGFVGPLLLYVKNPQGPSRVVVFDPKLDPEVTWSEDDFQPWNYSAKDAERWTA